MLPTCIFDTETLGLYGPMAVLQAKFDYATPLHGTDPFLYSPWERRACETLVLIEEMVKCRCVAHNITFDWQKLSQFYNALRTLVKTHGPNVKPIDHIDEMARLIFSCREDFCLKPAAAVCTLMLCQKSSGGAALAAKEVRIRKLTPEIAPSIAKLLNAFTQLPDIMFARRQSEERWGVYDNDEDPDWKDVALKFAPSNKLKDIARFVLGVDDVQKIGEEIQPPPFPFELGYAPYAVMLNDGCEDWTHKRWDKKSAEFKTELLWPRLLEAHVAFWTEPDSDQVVYALDDIVLAERLLIHMGNPETDFDSELGCQVASVRVAGFEIDMDKLEIEQDRSNAIVDEAEINVDSPVQVRAWIEECLDDIEKLVIADGCNKAALIAMTSDLILAEPEHCCSNGCMRCDGKGTLPVGPMPVVGRVEHVLKIRKHKKRLQLFTKLEKAEGAYPSFRVIGTKSGRMSGTDGLNYHGIDGSNEIREIFNLTVAGLVCGGDMNSQELSVAAAVMNDANLDAEMREGKSLHGVFAAEAFGVSYEQIMRYKDNKKRPEAEWYKKAKICVYAILYGAASYNISVTLGCPVEEAEATIVEFFKKYPYMAETRKLVKKSLEAIRTDENGFLKIVKPEKTYIDSLFGFRRSFDCEYAVMNIMFGAMKHFRSVTTVGGPLNEMIDQMWHGYIDLDRKVIRSDKKGVQTLRSAVQSALYGAVFSLQGKILRAALNHLIQSAGRTITLRVQKRIWDEVQPVGIHPFVVKLLSVHDEIITSSVRDNAVRDKITHAVKDEMAELAKVVPLLSLDWATDVGSWYGVKAAVPSLEGLTDKQLETAVLADQFIRCGWEG